MQIACFERGVRVIKPDPLTTWPSCVPRGQAYRITIGRKLFGVTETRLVWIVSLKQEVVTTYTRLRQRKAKIYNLRHSMINYQSVCTKRMAKVRALTGSIQIFWVQLQNEIKGLSSYYLYYKWTKLSKLSFLQLNYLLTGYRDQWCTRTVIGSCYIYIARRTPFP